MQVNMLWVQNGLVDKLVAAKVAERQWNNVVFTKSFGLFILRCMNKQVPMRTLEECRKLMCHYDSDLSALTDGEVRAIIVLLGFYLDHSESNISAAR